MNSSDRVAKLAVRDLQANGVDATDPEAVARAFMSDNAAWGSLLGLDADRVNWKAVFIAWLEARPQHKDTDFRTLMLGARTGILSLIFPDTDEGA
ncbi:hypothetical protein [Rhodospirillum sp. A1_3_36]|uniref:hypothetical protein n=1 Tax=Rhodospirillum sp. A1_3_36 TaxID=3391666 RepID=UPI0039A44312